MTMVIDGRLLRHVAWLDECRGRMVGLVERLCNQNSWTHNAEGLAIVGGWLEDEFRATGGQIEWLPANPYETVDDRGELVHEQTGPILRITGHAAVRPRVILCIHRDTVYPPDGPFQQCRWLDAERLNGPGVIDAKGGLVVMLHALLALERSPLRGRIGWQVIINADEEIGSPGSQRILNEAARQADLGLLFEPALPDGKLVSWRKGVGNFQFVVRGRSAHSGRDFQNGRNAVVALSRLLVRVHELNTDPEVTFNPGRVTGGGPLNVVPDLAVGGVNVRVRTVDQQRRVERQLAELVARSADEDGIRVAMHGGFTSPPKELIPGTAELQARIEAAGTLLGIQVDWAGSGGGSDGNKFAAAGLPNIDSLGPQGGAIHSPDEFLKASSLVPAAKLAGLVLLSLAAEADDLPARSR